MQAHYNDSPSPPGPSSLRPRAENVRSAQRAEIDPSGPLTSKKRRHESPTRSPRQPKNATPTQSKVANNGSDDSIPNLTRDKGKMKEENLNHIPQADPLDTVKEGTQPPVKSQYDGMTEQEIFKIVTRPEEIEGVEDWGIPPAADPKFCDPKLKTRIEQFLRLKYENNQHINTSLLSSHSFHNPHIYSKLVEFVDLSERQSHFPLGGWVTRLGLEGEISTYGPKRLSEVQKSLQDQKEASMGVGKRSRIGFVGGKKVEKGDGASKRDGQGERTRDRDRDRDRDGAQRDRGKGNGRFGDTLGLARDRDGGWDERDMSRDKPRYRYY